MSPETLAPDVAWEPSGHLSEVALSVAADGEYTLFDPAMHEHLASCEACAAQLGSVALRSADVAEALAAVPGLAAERRPAMAPSRRRVPVLAIAAALVVAAVGALPSVLSVPERAAQAWSVFRKVAPSIVRLAPAAADRALGGPGVRVVILWALAALLLAMGLGIAKRASKKMALDGGRR
jgi:hypothetical protein